MNVIPNPSYSFTLRLEINSKVGMLAKVMAAIGEAGGDIGAVDLVQSSREVVVRDITVATGDEVHAAYLVSKVKEVAGVQVVNVSDRTFAMHQGGKISVVSKFPIKNRDQLSQAY